MPDDTPMDSAETPRTRVMHLVVRLQRALNTCLVTLQQGLPLFRMEMLVQASRPRTYIVRSISAVVLFFQALAYTAVVTGTPLLGPGMRLSGQGHVILNALVWMLFAYIYVYAPATTCSVITLERERQSLVLLYLTKLTAWHIIAEKFLSRLLPLLTNLLLALPLLVFAYTFGGVSYEMLATAIWFLCITAIQVTAVAVLCSAICQRTMQAFIFTYGLLILMYVGPFFLNAWISNGSFIGALDATRNATSNITTISNLRSDSPNNWAVAIPVDYLLHACCPPILFTPHYSPAITGTQFSYEAMFLAGVPTLISALASLILARILLYYRAFEPQRFAWYTRVRLRLKQFAKRKRRDASSSIDGQPTLIDMPGDEPIAWHEQLQGRRAWLIIMLMLEVPTLALAVWLARISDGDSLLISGEICGLWAASVLLLCMNSASLITRERNQQTLELLLTTPLSSTEIIKQKFNGTRQVRMFAAIPLLSCILFQAWWRSLLPAPTEPIAPQWKGEFLWWEYVITAISCIAIYFPLVSWIALWSGLKNKSATRATLQSLGWIVGICCAPQIILLLPLLAVIPIQILTQGNILAILLAQTSPLSMIVLAEFTNLRVTSDLPLVPTVANAVFYGAVLYFLRRYILQRADVLLGRTVYY